jgi:hypothetical protein
MAGSTKRAALGGLAVLAAIGACGREPIAPSPRVPGPEARPAQIAPASPPGTYFEHWPDLEVEPALDEGGPERFLQGGPSDAGALPQGPASQTPLRTLQRR